MGVDKNIRVSEYINKYITITKKLNRMNLIAKGYGGENSHKMIMSSFMFVFNVLSSFLQLSVCDIAKTLRIVSTSEQS